MEDLRIHFENQSRNLNEDLQSNYLNPYAKCVNEKFIKWLKHQIEIYLAQIQEFTDAYKPNGEYSVYSGSGGYALLYLRLCDSNASYPKILLQKALVLINNQLEQLSGCNFSFLTGDAGLLAIAAVLQMRHGRRNLCLRLLEQLRSYCAYVCDLSKSEITDDLYSGRAGYLYALLFVYTNIEHQTVITNEIIRKVVEAILRSGQERALKTGSTLCFSSSEKSVCLGILSGQAGVLHVLLLAMKYLALDEFDTLLKPAILFLKNKRTSSHNYPINTSGSSEELVQWCHGASGICHLFLSAYSHFTKDRKLRDMLLKEAISCAECVWERGLLVKGYGLCHGIAGNAYVFLRIYQVTKREMYLHRAFKFADYCVEYRKYFIQKGINAMSLFEGLGGLICLLNDLTEPRKSQFPAFQLIA